MLYVCCIVKPPSIIHTSAIWTHLEESGFRVGASTRVRYTPALVDVLYDHMSMNARAMISRKYNDQIGVALCIAAPSIEACMNAIGTESDPSCCEYGTVRHRFGRHGDPERIGEWDWWENALHRPVDEREQLRDLQLFFPEHYKGAG